MDSIFSKDPADSGEVEAARSGDKRALESLIGRHQPWIYNVALRMVGNPVDAEDVTQEVLIKVITRLSSFEGRSSFRTWVYRIAVNHVLTMRRRAWERLFFSFDRHAQLIESLPDAAAPDCAEERLLLEETKSGCITGMLLCLDRQERIALILSTFFDASSALGGELLETTPENYRQILSRSRRRLGSFMNDRCGLLNPDKPCRCARKTRSAVQAGLVDPGKLRFNLPYLHRIREFVQEKAPLVDAAVEMKLQGLLREQPFYTSPDFRRIVDVVLRRRDVRQVIDFG